jgi:peptidoglycan/LPS O-acetylase OafA/YrhL
MLEEFADTGAISLRNFYIRRVIRLYPPLLVLIAASAIVAIAQKLPVEIEGYFASLFYFMNYYLGYLDLNNSAFIRPPGLGPLWSLSVEEHFYILFPLTVFLVRGKSDRLILAALAVCALCLVIRIGYILFLPPKVASVYTYQNSEARFDSMLIACTVLVACFAVQSDDFRNTLRYSLQGGGLFILVAAVVFTERYTVAYRILNSALLVWIGQLSYSLYLWHQLVAHFLVTTTDIDRVLGHVPSALFTVVASFVLAAASYYLIEQPFQALRKRFR